MQSFTTAAEQIVNRTQEECFKIVSNHRFTHNFVFDVKKCTVLEEGETKNGKGTVREVKFKSRLWPSIKERVIFFDPPKHYAYKIISGMPGLEDHLGEWHVEAINENESKVIWTVYFKFKKAHLFYPLRHRFVNRFECIQKDALENLLI